MESIRELYRIGNGPSSSHTMGPRKAASRFLQQQPDAATYRVTLFGSLAATGHGHLTDKVLEDAFSERELTLVWKPEEELPLHPNALRFEAFDNQGEVLKSWDVYSVGGGALLDEESDSTLLTVDCPSSMDEMLAHCEASGESFWEYMVGVEGEEIWSFLDEIWHAMSTAMERGLRAEGVLPGGLALARKAHSFYRKASLYGEEFKQISLLSAYALAVSEENAAGSVIVTAPTCGASGILPAVLRHINESLNCDRVNILRALATAGLIGNLVKHNASISGAEVGCQGEVGTACAMAAAAATQLFGGSVRQIEYAAEMGLEHHLGLTCDPVKGLVQIPCIERNAHAASRALSCCNFALLSDGAHKISFDEIVAVMKETGQALPSLYRETAGGGIAQVYRQREKKND
jgi:L-serine dehydratase